MDNDLGKEGAREVGWESRTPQERAAAFRRWVKAHRNDANLPDEALRRGDIYN